MKNLLLLCCLFLTFATFTSCIEEDLGLSSMQSTRELERYEELHNGTGLPRGLEMVSIVYESKTGESITEELPHVLILFDECADEWCKALTDDCGASAEVRYNYKDEGEGASLAFDALSTSPTLSEWATRQVFSFERVRFDVTLSCSGCPGETSDGFEFENRTVELKAVR